jgi:hypothetical protein
MENEKPELLTRSDLMTDYYFMLLVNEQRKTNQLLEQLLDKKQIVVSSERKSWTEPIKEVISRVNFSFSKKGL